MFCCSLCLWPSRHVTTVIIIIITTTITTIPTKHVFKAVPTIFNFYFLLYHQQQWTTFLMKKWALDRFLFYFLNSEQTHPCSINTTIHTKRINRRSTPCLEAHYMLIMYISLWWSSWYLYTVDLQKQPQPSPPAQNSNIYQQNLPSSHFRTRESPSEAHNKGTSGVIFICWLCLALSQK